MRRTHQLACLRAGGLLSVRLEIVLLFLAASAFAASAQSARHVLPSLSATAGPASRPVPQKVDRPAGSLQRAIEQAVYAVEPTGKPSAGFTADNPQQGFQATFT